jgi:ATP-dependent helicase HepA
MRDGYLRLCNSVQGLRRHVEQVGSTVSSALGVRASIYPHQVGTVWRILSDLQIRHLLADEVGLGKTIQALMVINALRLEDPETSVAIVVPDSLMPQWRDELLARGHEAPIYENSGSDSARRHVRLFWPKMLQRASDIDPAEYPFVVVDELHNLQVDIRDHLARNARKFTGLLALTATPKLQDPTRRIELLSLLEPERVYLAAKHVTTDDQWQKDEPFRLWPRTLQEAILRRLGEEEESIASMLGGAQDVWQQAGLEHPPTHDPESCAAMRWCVHRRIIRSRRSDFRGLLPERVHIPSVIEPTSGEISRQSSIWKYIHLQQPAGPVDRELLARRSIIGPHSLRIRLGELVRTGNDTNGLLENISAHLNADEGDSRLDELVDILASIWFECPTEKVVVACQDSPTVEYLKRNISARLSQVGSIRERRPLEIAEIRGAKDNAPEDLLAADSPIQQALGSFQQGGAQLLLASDVAHIGLNLQCARVMILYSVPWGPDEIEQWVGRLDRIGNQAIKRDEGMLPIDVRTIVLNGLVDQQVVDELSRFDVFSQVLDLEDAELLASAHEAVSCGALDGAWAGVDDAAHQFKDIDIRTPLQHELPYGLGFTSKVYARESSRPPADPSLASVGDQQTNWKTREISIEAWLRLLSRSNEYDIRKAKEPGENTKSFRTLWYRAEDIKKDIESIITLFHMHDPIEKSPKHAEAFITRRNEIKHPCRKEVELRLGSKLAIRPLQYLNHGSLLHEDLLESWIKSGRDSPPETGLVVFPKGHDALADPGVGMYAITVAWADAGIHVLPSLQEKLDDVPEAVRSELMPHAIAEHRNDKWWLRGILPARMLCYVERLSKGSEPDVLSNPATCWALLRPFLADSDKHELPHAIKWDKEPNKEGINNHRHRASEFLRQQMSRHWKGHIEELTRAVRTRLFVQQGDSDAVNAVNADYISQEERKVENIQPDAAQIVHASANAKLTRAKENRDARGLLDAARSQRLSAVMENMNAPQIGIHRTVILEVKAGQSSYK